MSKIKNLTKDTTIAKNCIISKGFRGKIRGLIGKTSNNSILIETRFGVHTFGMRNSLDIMVLNNEGRVVKIREGLKPRKFFLWNPKYKNVLELPGGSINGSNTTVGDMVSL